MQHPVFHHRFLVRLVAAGLLGLAGLPAAMGAGITMDCDHDEITVMGAQAQQGQVRAERLGAGTLQVRWQGGRQRFEDRVPVVDTDFVEEHYVYCGYNPAAHLHLIRKDTGESFTGLLINDLNGKITDAGYTVILSPDLSRFLAVRQYDSMEGEVWVMSNFEGKTLWQGRTSLKAEGDEGEDGEDDELIAELEAPHWLPSGELQATHTCLGTDEVKSTTVVLKRSKHTGKDIKTTYHWLPKVTCPAQP